MHWPEAAKTGALGAISMGVLGLLAMVTGTPMVFPSLGPTAFMFAYRPSMPAACPRNAVVGHTIGAACGLLAVVVCGLYGAPNAFEVGITPARAGAAALALSGTGALMALVERPHPPAGATTLIVSLGLMASTADVAVLLVAVLVLCAVGVLFSRAIGAPLPLWGPV